MNYEQMVTANLEVMQKIADQLERIADALQSPPKVDNTINVTTGVNDLVSDTLERVGSMIGDQFFKKSGR
ncbi:hypothetical protein ACIQYW_18945 [Rhodococcus erythropolis]|uniref:hypothetical protein n=1 Tax=Actinomycetes TaxID=1760 RepID=UPI00038F7E98|nr:hypothetical protein N806_20135 [Rhodococcus sp. P27]